MSGPVSIDTLEMMLKEQAEKDESLHLDGEIVLNRDLVDQLKALDEKKRRLIGAAAGSTGGAAGVDTSEVDAEIEAKIAEAEQYVVKVHFQALSSDDYLRVVKRHPEARNSFDEANVSEWNEFLIDLADTCYVGCTFKGTRFGKDSYPLANFRAQPAVGFGQLKPILDEVLNLNQETPDRSFLSRRSKPSPTT